MSTIFGDIKAGQIAVINQYGLVATHDFNVYEEYSLFREQYGPCLIDEENDDYFVDYLIQNRDLGVDIEEAVSNKVDFELEITVATPTYEQIVTLMAFQTPAMLELDHLQVSCLAVSLDMIVNQEGDTVAVILDSMRERGDATIITKEAYLELVLCIDMRKMQEIEKNHILKHGFCVRSVFADNGGLNFSYTVGLSATLGYELAAAIKNLPAQTIGQMVSIAARALLDGKEEFSLGYLRGNGEDLKYKIIDHDVALLEASEVLVRTKSPVKFIVLPDMNNRLPWDEGYDHGNFPQPIPADVIERKGETAPTVH